MMTSGWVPPGHEPSTEDGREKRAEGSRNIVRVLEIKG